MLLQTTLALERPRGLRRLLLALDKEAQLGQLRQPSTSRLRLLAAAMIKRLITTSAILIGREIGNSPKAETLSKVKVTEDSMQI